MIYFVSFPTFQLEKLFVYLSVQNETINVTKNTIKETSVSINTKEKTKANILQPLLHPGGHSALTGCKDDYWKKNLCKYSNESTEDSNSMRTDVKTGTLPDYISHHAPQ